MPNEAYALPHDEARPPRRWSGFASAPAVVLLGETQRSSSFGHRLIVAKCSHSPVSLSRISGVGQPHRPSRTVSSGVTVARLVAGKAGGTRT